jgi:hypothetical protein
MDLFDLDDPYTYLDPDSGETLLATWDGHDLEDRDDWGAPYLPGDYAFSDPLHGDLSSAALGGGVISGPGASLTPGTVVSGAGLPAMLVSEELPVARRSTIQRFEAAVAASRLHLQASRAEARLAATTWSFTLNDTFLCDGFGSLLSRPPAVAGVSLAVTGDEIAEWLEQSTTFFRCLRDLTLWVRGAAIFLLPDIVLEDIACAAWDLFCATLIFPRTRSAFEAFTDSPVASPEAARYRLAGVGPVGPPLPLSHARPFCAPWGVEHYNICRDDVFDLEATAVIAVQSLEVIIDWVMAAPVSDLAPEVRGEASRTAWELYMASLRIPRAREEFEQLCSDPPALRQAAGLSLIPSAGTSTVEEVSQQSRARRHVRRGRRSG